MNIRVLVASALALGVLATAANALSVVNDDDAAYTLKITPKTGKPIDLQLKAKGTAVVDVKDGGSILLNGKTATFDAKAVKIVVKKAAIVVN